MIVRLTNLALHNIFIATITLGLFSTFGASAASATSSTTTNTTVTAVSSVSDTRAVARADTPTVQVRRTVYVCPMHPRIRSKNPGSCSLCGMALVRRIEVVNVPAPATRSDTSRAPAAAPSADSPTQPVPSSASPQLPSSSGGHSCCSTPRAEAH
jgi:hypothetical protein